MKISIVVGIILAMPVLLYQLWAFVAPGLTPSNEREPSGRGSRSRCSSSRSASAIAYFILPFAIAFLFSFTDDDLVSPACGRAVLRLRHDAVPRVRPDHGVPDRAGRPVAGRDRDLGPAAARRAG